MPLLHDAWKGARRSIAKGLLVRLEAARDALETRAERAVRQGLDFTNRWNPRRANSLDQNHRVLSQGHAGEPGGAKNVGIGLSGSPSTITKSGSPLGGWFA